MRLADSQGSYSRVMTFSKMEALRCLKRYISREVYTLLRNQNRLINSTQITA
jgi:hypothetical protein